MSSQAPTRSRARRALALLVGAAVVATASVVIAAPGSAENETVIRTLAGSRVEADPGRLAAPRTMAVDNAGNIFFTDTDNHLIRRLDPSGVVTNIAGTGSEGEGPDGGAGHRLGHLATPRRGRRQPGPRVHRRQPQPPDPAGRPGQRHRDDGGGHRARPASAATGARPPRPSSTGPGS